MYPHSLKWTISKCSNNSKTLIIILNQIMILIIQTVEMFSQTLVLIHWNFHQYLMCFLLNKPKDTDEITLKMKNLSNFLGDN